MAALAIAGVAASLVVDDTVNEVLTLVDDSVSGNDFIAVTCNGQPILIRATAIVSIAA